MGVLDDSAIADALASSLLTKGGKVINIFAGGLAEKGVARDKAAAIAAAHTDDDMQLNSAVTWLRGSGKRYLKAESSPEERSKSKKRLSAALIRRGYRSPVIRRVFALLDSGELENPDFQPGGESYG